MQHRLTKKARLSSGPSVTEEALRLIAVGNLDQQQPNCVRPSSLHYSDCRKATKSLFCPSVKFRLKR